MNIDLSVALEIAQIILFIIHAIPLYVIIKELKKKLTILRWRYYESGFKIGKR